MSPKISKEVKETQSLFGAVVTLLIIVLVLAFVIAFFPPTPGGNNQPSSPSPLSPSTLPYYSPSSPFTPDMSVKQKKTVLLDLINRAKTAPLSDAERNYILQEFGGERTASYNFTDVEKAAILRALNAK